MSSPNFHLVQLTSSRLLLHINLVISWLFCHIQGNFFPGLNIHINSEQLKGVCTEFKKTAIGRVFIILAKLADFVEI